MNREQAPGPTIVGCLRIQSSETSQRDTAALGGAIGAAALGAVFASRVGHTASTTLALTGAGRAGVISGVHVVFLTVAPIAVIALLTVLALKEVPLRGPGGRPAGERPQTGQPAAAAAAR
jgi:hypothetical protein